MKNIYVLGECMIELMTLAQEAPSSVGSSTMKQSFAGDVFNTAVYLKRLFSDIKVNMVTAVGQDHFSDDMVECFKGENLTTDYVFRAEKKIPGLYAIHLDEHGERSFSYWRNNSAARNVMSFIDQNVLAEVSQGDMFFFSGISLGVITPNDRDKFWLFIKSLKASGVKIAFDLNYRHQLWPDKEQARQQFIQAFELADILLPGVDDFAAIFELNAVEPIIEFFSQYDYQELVIKNGEKNVYCLSSNEQNIVDVTPVANVVDTTSAGDSFNGGYLGARMAGQSLSQSVELAIQIAGFVIQHKGAIVDKAAFSSRFN